MPWESDDVIKLAGEADRSASIDFQGLYLFNGDAYKARGKEEIEHEGKSGKNLLTTLYKRFGPALIYSLLICNYY